MVGPHSALTVQDKVVPPSVLIIAPSIIHVWFTRPNTLSQSQLMALSSFPCMSHVGLPFLQHFSSSPGFLIHHPDVLSEETGTILLSARNGCMLSNQKGCRFFPILCLSPPLMVLARGPLSTESLPHVLPVSHTSKPMVFSDHLTFILLVRLGPQAGERPFPRHLFTL